MTQIVESIVFRRLTGADFRHINHKGSHYQGGGGQSYIDFPVKEIAVQTWEKFLGKPSKFATKGPVWKFEINSLGISEKIELKIYQRRAQSISIASQKIFSRKSNRVPAWHPKNEFPTNYDPTDESLIIYILKTKEGMFWAGWFFDVKNKLNELFHGQSSGFYHFNNNNLTIDTSDGNWTPFIKHQKKHKTKSNEEKANELLEEDISQSITLDDLETSPSKFQERVIKFRKRNNVIVRKLKQLYKGHCQISGTEYTFQKKNGEWYSEVHHLIPLGEEGSDSYENVIVVSPLIHRMLHYANVSEIDLNKIRENKLIIQINNSDYTISWHESHAKIISETIVS